MTQCKTILEHSHFAENPNYISGSLLVARPHLGKTNAALGSDIPHYYKKEKYCLAYIQVILYMGFANSLHMMNFDVYEEYVLICHKLPNLQNRLIVFFICRCYI